MFLFNLTVQLVLLKANDRVLACSAIAAAKARGTDTLIEAPGNDNWAPFRSVFGNGSLPAETERLMKMGAAVATLRRLRASRLIGIGKTKAGKGSDTATARRGRCYDEVTAIRAGCNL